MKIKTVIFAPSETFSLQHQRNTARSEESTKTKITPKQAMMKGGGGGEKKLENKQKVGIFITSELVKKLREEEREEGEKNIKSLRKARRAISQWMSPEQQHSASKI